MAPASGFEDQAVDSLDFSNMSDADLAKVAADDERDTAKQKAQAEMNRREAKTTDESAPSEDDTSAPPTVAEQAGTGKVIDGDITAEDIANADPGDKLMSLEPTDPMERAEGRGIDTDGINLDPDAGQAAVQAYANAVEESGVIPPTGGPPDDSLTLSEVVKTEQAAREAMFERQRVEQGK